MSLKPKSEDEILSGQKELKDKFIGHTKYESLNLKSIVDLNSDARLEFPAGSGAFYRVPAVPYVEGLRLNEYYMEIMEARRAEGQHATARLEMLLRFMLDIMWKLCIPESRVRRIAKKFRIIRNPFHRASEGDAAALIAFFLARRMKPNVMFHYPAMDQNHDK